MHMHVIKSADLQNDITSDLVELFYEIFLGTKHLDHSIKPQKLVLKNV